MVITRADWVLLQPVLASGLLVAWSLSVVLLQPFVSGILLLPFVSRGSSRLQLFGDSVEVQGLGCTELRRLQAACLHCDCTCMASSDPLDGALLHKHRHASTPWSPLHLKARGSARMRACSQLAPVPMHLRGAHTPTCRQPFARQACPATCM